MEGFIDIHSHIIPGVDDGSRSLEMTHEMLQQAYLEGIRAIIATPHYHTGNCVTEPEVIREKLAIVQAEARKINENFLIYPGTELYYKHEAVELLESGEILTLADSKYVLVEFSPMRDFNYMKDSLYQLLLGGYRPILAHVERYGCLVKDLVRVEDIAEMGVYLQANAMSVTGGNGRGAKVFLKKLLKNQILHFIGTDSHSLGERSPKIQQCSEYISRKYGEEYMKELLVKNPKKIIDNEYI